MVDQLSYSFARERYQTSLCPASIMDRSLPSLHFRVSLRLKYSNVQMFLCIEPDYLRGHVARTLFNRSTRVRSTDRTRR